MDAPERIWAKRYYRAQTEGYWNDAPIQPNRLENVGVEYIRADIHATEVARLRAALYAIAGEQPFADDPWAIARAALDGRQE